MIKIANLYSPNHLPYQDPLEDHGTVNESYLYGAMIWWHLKYCGFLEDYFRAALPKGQTMINPAEFLCPSNHCFVGYEKEERGLFDKICTEESFLEAVSRTKNTFLVKTIRE